MMQRASSGTRTTAFVVGGVVLAGACAAMATAYLPEDDVASPFADTGAPLSAETLFHENPAALEQGRVYYVQLCMSCHGARGDGLGEWAYRVTPRPANLRSARTRGRSDAQLYDMITDGIPGTPMMGWKKQLSDMQRQQIVVYLRHLGARP